MTISDPGSAQMDVTVRRRREWLIFLFLTVFLAPFLAVAFVGGYGFLIWIYQIFTGPPGA